MSTLQEQIDAILVTLGIDPNGVYANVRARLDILEARINNPNVASPTVTNPFYIDGYGGVSISVGDGYPTESRNNGSLYLRRDGALAEGLYARRSGAWYQVDTYSTTASVFNLITGKTGSLSNGTDGYLLTNLSEISDETFPAYSVNSDSGTIDRLTVTCTQKPTASETVVITVRKNYTDTALTVTLDSSAAASAGGYSVSDLSNSISIALDDVITISYVSSASADVENLMVTVRVL